MKTTEEIQYIIETFINGNRNYAVEKMKELKDFWQERELLDELWNHKKEFQIELLSCFYKS